MKRFLRDDPVRKIVIPSSIKTIRKNAFYDNYNLIEVVFEENSSLETIEDSAFEGNKNLQSINLPSTLKFIGRSAFDFTQKLESLNLSNVQFIGEGAFRGSGVKEIIGNERYVFNDGLLIDREQHRLIFASPHLTGNITIPSDVKIIDNHVFSYHLHIYRVDLNNVEHIGDSAFSGVKYLSFVEGKHVKSIGDHAFYGTMWIDYNRATTTLGTVLVNYKGSDVIYEVPEGIETISSWAFTSNTLERIILPKSLKKIDDFAFISALNLKDVLFQTTDAVTIGQELFHENTMDVVLYIPAISYDNGTYHNDPRFSSYAERFMKKIVTVNFIDVDGTILDTKEIPYYAYIEDLPVVHRPGYSFLYWRVKGTDRTYQNNSIFKEFDDVVTLEAVYSDPEGI